MSDFILQFINVAMLVWKFENIPQTVCITVWGLKLSNIVKQMKVKR